MNTNIVKTEAKAVGAIVANTLFVAALLAGIAGIYLYTGSITFWGFMIVVPSALLAAQVAVGVGTGLFFVLALLGRLFVSKEEDIA